MIETFEKKTYWDIMDIVDLMDKMKTVNYLAGEVGDAWLLGEM